MLNKILYKRSPPSVTFIDPSKNGGKKFLGSYLSGNSGASSILRSDELDRYFPDRKLRLFVGSWNMNGQTPPAYLADFLLPQHIEYVPGA